MSTYTAACSTRCCVDTRYAGVTVAFLVFCASYHLNNHTLMAGGCLVNLTAMASGGTELVRCAPCDVCACIHGRNWLQSARRLLWKRIGIQPKLQGRVCEIQTCTSSARAVHRRPHGCTTTAFLRVRKRFASVFCIGVLHWWFIPVLLVLVEMSTFKFVYQLTSAGALCVTCIAVSRN